MEVIHISLKCVTKTTAQPIFLIFNIELEHSRKSCAVEAVKERSGFT
jgi:hypothetical protein